MLCSGWFVYAPSMWNFLWMPHFCWIGPNCFYFVTVLLAYLLIGKRLVLYVWFSLVIFLLWSIENTRLYNLQCALSDMAFTSFKRHFLDNKSCELVFVLWRLTQPTLLHCRFYTFILFWLFQSFGILLQVLELMKKCIVSMPYCGKLGEIIQNVLFSDSSIHNTLLRIACTTAHDLEVT